MSWCYGIKWKYIRQYELFMGNCGDKQRQQTQWTETLLIPFQTNTQKDVYNCKWKYKGCGKLYWNLTAICYSQYRRNSRFLPPSHHHKPDTTTASRWCLTPEKQLFWGTSQSFPLVIAFGLLPTPSPQTLREAPVRAWCPAQDDLDRTLPSPLKMLSHPTCPELSCPGACSALLLALCPQVSPRHPL